MHGTPTRRRTSRNDLDTVLRWLGVEKLRCWLQRALARAPAGDRAIHISVAETLRADTSPPKVRVVRLVRALMEPSSRGSRFEICRSGRPARSPQVSAHAHPAS